MGYYRYETNTVSAQWPAMIPITVMAGFMGVMGRYMEYGFYSV